MNARQLYARFFLCVDPGVHAPKGHCPNSRLGAPMKAIFALVLASTIVVSLAHADSDDLSGGVFIAHAPPGVVC
jgi:hypothetical protein